MKAADWMRRWVRLRRIRYCLLCVCFLPRLLACKRGGGLQMTGHSPPSLVVMTYSPCIAWASISPPRFGRVSICLPYTVHTLSGLCVLESPVGAVCPVCCNPVFIFPTFDAFTVATVCWDWNWQLMSADASIWRRKHSISNSLTPSGFGVLESLQQT